MTESTNERLTLAKQYEQLAMEREPYLNRARSCAKLTIPALIPPQGHTPSSPLPSPYQSLGSRGVNNLAARIMLTSFPPQQPFFKYALEEHVREALGARVGDVERLLSKSERIVMSDLEASGFRPPIFLAAKHLIVAGNILLHDDRKTGRMRAFPLYQYVVQRDPAGTVLKIIIKEVVSPSVLPEEVRAVALEEAKRGGQSNSTMKTVDVFTGIELRGNRHHVHQEVAGVTIPGSEGHYPADESPWYAARLIEVEGEAYGRSYVEEYYGDLLSLELLQKALVLGSVELSKLIRLVNPNGVTEQQDLEEAETGDWITGDGNDVTTLQAEKHFDFQYVEKRIDALRRDLGFAFLLNSAVQRDGERVTAQEIRYLANELEAALGGVHATLARELQLPIVRSRAAALRAKGKFPKLPASVVPTITTGIDAIGRGNDFDRLHTYVSFLTDTLGPDRAARRLNDGELAARAAAALGIVDDGLIKTDEEIAEEDERAREAAMQQAAIGPAINQIGQMARSQQQPGG